MLKIKEIRQARNLTQQALGELMSVDRTTVNKWETGVNSPTAKTLMKLAEVLHCNVSDFFCD